MKLTNFSNPWKLIYLKKCAAREMRFKGIIKSRKKINIKIFSRRRIGFSQFHLGIEKE
jgi:hypothetical protein